MGQQIISKEELDLLISTLKEFQDTTPQDAGSQRRNNKGKNKDVNIDPSSTESVCSHLIRALIALHKEVKLLREKTESSVAAPGDQTGMEQRLEKQDELIREQQDEMDEIKQRSLKGNLILSSKTFPERKLTSVILSDQELKSRNLSLVDHVLQLVHQKYGVRIPKDEVQACHRLPNGSIILRLWKRTEDAAWSPLIKSIKEGGKGGPSPNLNLFLNFHLTHRRNELVYELRQLKKDGKISKFYTDEKWSHLHQNKGSGQEVQGYISQEKQ